MYNVQWSTKGKGYEPFHTCKLPWWTSKVMFGAINGLAWDKVNNQFKPLCRFYLTPKFSIYNKQILVRLGCIVRLALLWTFLDLIIKIVPCGLLYGPIKPKWLLLLCSQWGITCVWHCEAKCMCMKVPFSLIVSCNM